MDAAPESTVHRPSLNIRPLAILLASTMLLAVFVAIGAGSVVYLVSNPGAEDSAKYSEPTASSMPSTSSTASSSTTFAPPDTSTVTLPHSSSTSPTTTSSTVPPTTSSTPSTTTTTLCGGPYELSCSPDGSCLGGNVVNSYGYCVPVECGKSINSGREGCGGQVLAQESDWCLPRGTDLFKTRRVSSMQ